MIKKIFTLFIISCFLLSGCIPYKVTNMPSNNSLNSAASYPLPYKPNDNDSVIYFVYSYYYIDIFFLVGALSESIEYGGSDIYLSSAKDSTVRYLGKPYETLCVKVPPGTYGLEIHNIIAKPTTIQKRLIIERNKVYIYGIKADLMPKPNISEVTLEQYPLDQGKYYIKQNVPIACPRYSSVLTQKAKVHWTITVNNKTEHIYQALFNRGPTQSNIRSAISPGRHTVIETQMTRDNIPLHLLAISEVPATSDPLFTPQMIAYQLKDYTSPKFSVRLYNRFFSKKPFKINSQCNYEAVNASLANLNCKVDIMPA